MIFSCLSFPTLGSDFIKPTRPLLDSSIEHKTETAYGSQPTFIFGMRKIIEEMKKSFLALACCTIMLDSFAYKPNRVCADVPFGEDNAAMCAHFCSEIRQGKRSTVKSARLSELTC